MNARVLHWEVTGRDPAALQRFYGSLFDWKIQTDGNPGGYGVVPGGEGSIGGGIGDSGDGPGAVTVYVGVPDIDASLARVVELGGSIVMSKTNVMPGLEIALFADPEGHVMGLLRGEMKPPAGRSTASIVTRGAGWAAVRARSSRP